MSSTFQGSDGDEEWPDEAPRPSDVPTGDAGMKTGEEDPERDRREEPPA